MSTPITSPNVDIHVSAPDPETGEQFLMRSYWKPGGVVRTIARRTHLGATWGPEHVLRAESAVTL